MSFVAVRVSSVRFGVTFDRASGLKEQQQQRQRLLDPGARVWFVRFHAMHIIWMERMGSFGYRKTHTLFVKVCACVCAGYLWKKASSAWACVSNCANFLCGGRQSSYAKRCGIICVCVFCVYSVCFIVRDWQIKWKRSPTSHVDRSSVIHNVFRGKWSIWYCDSKVDTRDILIHILNRLRHYQREKVCTIQKDE